MSETSYEARLQEPFEPNDIKWRVQQSGVSKGRVWMIVLPYITGRAIQKRLDDVFGVFGWEVDQKETLAGDGFITTLRISQGDRWVSKTDVAPKTGIDPLKGGASGGLKRAGALLGIGRYLYQLESGFAQCVPCDNRYKAIYNYAEIKDKNNQGSKYGVDWQPPELPAWALPGLDTSKFEKDITDAVSIVEVKNRYDQAYCWANSFSRLDLIKKFKEVRDQTIDNLKKAAVDNVSKNEAEVQEWLNQKLKNIESTSYSSAVHSVADSISEELIQKCEGQHFDKEKFYKQLKDAVKARVKHIEGKAQ